MEWFGWVLLMVLPRFQEVCICSIVFVSGDFPWDF